MQGPARIHVGISSCLLGEKVRYNGEDRQADLLLHELGPHVQWVPVCPEVEVGMGVPREPIELVEENVPEAAEQPLGGVDPDTSCRLVGVESRRDWTGAMKSFAALCTSRLEKLGVSGYIFKSRSPSCGLEGVPIHAPDGTPARAGSGLFAAALRAHFPDLPVSEESALIDAAACREFLKRVRDFHRRKR